MARPDRSPAAHDPGEAPGPRRLHEMPVGEHFEDVEALEQLAGKEGIGGVKVAAVLIEDELRAKSPVRRLGEIVLALAIAVAVFARVIPQLLGVEYREVLIRLRSIDELTTAGLLALWVFTMWTYAAVVSTSLPGLSRFQGIVLNFSGSTLSNVVPFGGAAGVGATYAQGLSWGFDIPALTLSIIVTGVWNVFAKLALPMIVLLGLVMTRQSSEGLSIAGILGFALLALAVAALIMVFRDERVAGVVGDAAQRAVNLGRRAVRRPPGDGLADRIVDFRHRTVGLVSRRWRRLTVWMVTYKASQALLQLLCARAVGVEGVGWIQIVAVYALGELLSTIPVTPSGLGFVEGGATHLLVTFGARPDAALAAVLCYRALTYALEIPLGGAGWLTWATFHSWRKPPGTMRSVPV